MWRMIYFLQKVQKKVTKNYKSAQKSRKVSKIAVFHSIGATIRTRQESLCLPYAEFFGSIPRCKFCSI